MADAHRTSGSGREIEKQQKREFVEGGPAEKPSGLRPATEMGKPKPRFDWSFFTRLAWLPRQSNCHSGRCGNCGRERDDLFWHEEDQQLYCVDVFRCEYRHYLLGERRAA